MLSMQRSALALLVLAGTLFAQQPNGPASSLVFAGQDGPAYPTVVNWSGTVISMDVSGAPGSIFNVYAAGANGQAGLAAGALNVPGVGIIDLDISAGFIEVLNGFAPTSPFDRLAQVGPTGTSEWTLPIINSGTIGAFQALVADATAPMGATLSAASEVNVTVGQNLLLTGGDDGVFQIPFVFGATTFYGTTYTDCFVTTNGNVTFGGADGDFAPSAAKFDAGFPRMAPLWTDLTPFATVGGAPLVGSFAESADGWTMHWSFLGHYVTPGNTMTVSPTAGNTFSLTYAYTATNPLNPTGFPGAIIFDYTTPNTLFNPAIPGGLAATWGTMGITPGGSAPASPSNPATSTPIDNAPIVFDPTVDPSTAGGTGLTPITPMSSYRADYPAQNTVPTAALSGTGLQIAFYPLGTGDTYLLY